MYANEVICMKKTVAIGIQDFENIRKNDYFYIDKTDFIREWWYSGDPVTLITRPRRFGKTLNMSMLNCFFSNRYADRRDMFEGLAVSKDNELLAEQGAYPVVFLSFAGIKGTAYEQIVKEIKKQIVSLYSSYDYLYNYEGFDTNEKTSLTKIIEDMDEVDAAFSLNLLSRLLEKYWKKKVIILLDEYDTPLQEAYIGGFWDKLTSFIRSLFNNTFKTNPSMERALMTGITRVSKESIFSDLNNLYAVTTTTKKYACAFGFTESEVFAAMDAQEMPKDDKAKIKLWYDGFTFGETTDIYNPWSVTMYIEDGKLGTHWANTSSNGLVGHLLKNSDPKIKMDFEKLLNDEPIVTSIDEQIVFTQLDENENAIWSLLLASGYLKVLAKTENHNTPYEPSELYTLALTNYEVKVMFGKLIRDWFAKDQSFNGFVKSMLTGNVLDMNRYMNDIALNTFSSFDSGSKPSGKEPEKFYHGFVLGLIVDKAADYIIRSNRESGYGRYDVVMEPRDKTKTAVILEFKVIAGDEGEHNLNEAADNALKQIEDKRYDTELIANGISSDRILKYGLAFEGKRCIIKKA